MDDAMRPLLSGSALWCEPLVAVSGLPELVDDVRFVEWLIDGAQDESAAFERYATGVSSYE
jgi:hypothetical protein